MSKDGSVDEHTALSTAAEGLSCTLSPEQLPRRAMDTAEMFARATARRPLDDGAHLTFDGSDETARELLEFVLAERRCCATLSFELEFVPDHSAVTLRLRGTGGQGRSIRAWADAER